VKQHRHTRGFEVVLCEPRLSGLYVLDDTRNPDARRGSLIHWRGLRLARSESCGLTFDASDTSEGAAGDFLRVVFEESYVTDIARRAYRRSVARAWDNGELHIAAECGRSRIAPYSVALFLLALGIGLLAVCIECLGGFGSKPLYIPPEFSPLYESVLAFVLVGTAFVFGTPAAMAICAGTLILRTSGVKRVTINRNRLVVQRREGVTGEFMWSDLLRLRRGCTTTRLVFAGSRAVYIPIFESRIEVILDRLNRSRRRHRHGATRKPLVRNMLVGACWSIASAAIAWWFLRSVESMRGHGLPLWVRVSFLSAAFVYPIALGQMLRTKRNRPRQKFRNARQLQRMMANPQ
jgi:hypothetical protein